MSRQVGQLLYYVTAVQLRMLKSAAPLTNPVLRLFMEEGMVHNILCISDVAHFTHQITPVITKMFEVVPHELKPILQLGKTENICKGGLVTAVMMVHKFMVINDCT